MAGQHTTRVGLLSAWERRARPAAVVVAASAVVAVIALVQACRGGKPQTAASASQGTEPPVTIVIQPPPPASTSAEPLRLDLSVELPEAAPPKPSAQPHSDGSGVIYE